jgi:hypothetical protein
MPRLSIGFGEDSWRFKDHIYAYILQSHSTEYIKDLEPSLQKAAVTSYADAIRIVFICQTIVATLAFFAVLFIEERPLP